jgi:TRAP-type C4-dicarboxylate transport system substrate-binding protein
MCQLIDERTGGRLKIEPSLGGALGFTATDTMRVMKENLAEMSDVTQAYLEGTDPILSIVGLPFILENYKEAVWFKHISTPYVQKVYSKYDGKILVGSFWCEQNFFTKKPVYSLADLKGIKARANSVAQSETWAALDMVPVQVPGSELYSALERGTIDAQMGSSMNTAQASGWNYLDYTVKINFGIGFCDIVVNINPWNELPDDIKLIVTETAREIQDKSQNGALIADRYFTGLLEKGGMETIVLEPAKRDEIVQKAMPVWDKLLEKAGPEGQQWLNEWLNLMGRTR